MKQYYVAHIKYLDPCFLSPDVDLTHKHVYERYLSCFYKICILSYVMLFSGPPGKRGRRGDPGESYFCFIYICWLTIQVVVSQCGCLSNDDSEVSKR